MTVPARFANVSRLAQQAVTDGVVPGAVILVSTGGQVVFREAFGKRALEPQPLPAGIDTIYDVASVTKAVVTSVLAMQAVDAAALRLDDPVRRLLPEFGDAEGGETKAAVTVRHLLAHAGGLPAHRPFYLTVPEGPERRLRIMQAAAREPLAGPPGVRALYTDLGFILLGWLVERIGGGRLDGQARQRIFAPLRLPACLFSPVGDAAAETGPRPVDVGAVAATERCPYRQRVVVGQVHDMNAFAMDGVAGHAGLFSTASDLAVIAQALVAAWRGDAGPTLVDRDVVREFWRPSDVPGSTWRLGWDGPADANSQAGTRLSRGAVGHLGFTGCSLWIDPARDLSIVLLSNRIHPAVRDDPRFRAFRPAVHDAILEALD
jgi:CubicO group peptidase (beta-lactamase class C family)